MADRTSEIRNLILKAKQAYYYGGSAIMTDAAYDALEEELRVRSPEDPLLAMIGAPVPPDTILTKAEHRIHMGSQNKVNSIEDFRSWYERHAAGGALHVGLKADGASAAAYYEAGRLRQVITRGDGVIGEDITANAIRFQGLPAYVNCPVHGPFSGAVRFEVVLTVANWAKVDAAMSKNPRNLGAGIMGRKNGYQSELLETFVFDINEDRNGEPVDFATEAAKSARARELGFTLIPHQLCPTPDDVIAYHAKIDATRDQLPFWIDGIVIKIDALATQQALGVVSNRPKGQVAWKFESVGAETVIDGYVLSGGHTGAIVPTAKLRPVEIGGTTVSSALLNNWEEIERLDVAVGDTVFVIKANDIIPKVIEVRERSPQRTPIVEPSRCPFCDSETGRRRNTAGDEGAVTVCLNVDCPCKATGKLKRWIKSLDILGIGDSVLEALVEQLDVVDAAGLYTLPQRQGELAAMIINTEKGIRLGDKRATSIIDAILGKRELSLSQFLGSLGIERLGKRRCELMINGAGDQLQTLEAWRDGRLRRPEIAAAAGVPSIGDSIQDAIDAAAGLIDQLLANGVAVTAADPAANAAAAPQKTVCITGKLPSGKKKGDYAELLQAIGYGLVDSVSKDLDYLVLADPDSTSSKAKKARQLGIELISEDALEALIASAPPSAERQPGSGL